VPVAEKKVGFIGLKDLLVLVMIGVIGYGVYVCPEVYSCWSC